MAIAEIVMPKMGESIMEATILRWHKKVGDFVKMDETLLDIATDKVDSEVPSTAEGIIKELVYDVNDVVPVGGILARIESEVSAAQPTKSEAPALPTVVEAPIVQQIVQPQPAPKVQSIPQPIQEVVTAEESTPQVVEPEFIPFVPQTTPAMGSSLNNRFFSPLVLNIANSEGLSLSELERIPGTGADGRVSKKDVLQYIADKRAGRVSANAPAQPVQQIFSRTANPIVAPVSVPQNVIEHTEDNLSVPVQTEDVLQQKKETKSYPINVKRITDEEIAQVEKEKIEAPVIENSIEEIPTSFTQHIEQVQESTPEAVVDHQEEKMSTTETIESKVEDVVEEKVEEIVQPVENKIEPVVEAPVVVTTAPKVEVPTEPAFNPDNYKNAEIVEMDRMRKLIAKHMVDSKHISPHVTSFTEADVTNMVTWRNSVKGEFEKREGMKITFTPMFIECILKVMKHYPIINSSVVGDKIIMKKDFNIGMATALPTGNLIVPVIKNAADMNFITLTRAVNTLADNARKGKLSPDDVMDGTFTFTNVGTFGSLMGTPIINQPQVAILAVGEIKKRPVVVETDKGDFIGIRHMMYLSMSYDHRIVDGSIGASFLADVAKELEAWDVNRQLKYVVKEWYVE